MDLGHLRLKRSGTSVPLVRTAYQCHAVWKLWNLAHKRATYGISSDLCSLCAQRILHNSVCWGGQVVCGTLVPVASPPSLHSKPMEASCSVETTTTSGESLLSSPPCFNTDTQTLLNIRHFKVQVGPKIKTNGVQVSPKTRNASTQYNIEDVGLTAKGGVLTEVVERGVQCSLPKELEPSIEFDEEEDINNEDDDDVQWVPTSENDESKDDILLGDNKTPVAERKFTVFESCLMQLSTYLCPTVSQVWLEERKRLLGKRKGKSLKLGGDARCCSPGHTAKYGSYSLMDLKTTEVLEMELVQSNEVNNSAAMELEGLKRCLNHLETFGRIKVTDFTTDRHSQVKKYMRVQKPKIKHWFDVWHVAKGVRKKLEERAKTKGLEVIGHWSRSIANHMYWVAASSKGNAPMVLEKWLSISNHVCNVHNGHNGKLFKKCAHSSLEEREWLTKDSKAHKNLKEIVERKYLLTDLPKLAPDEQTSALESFHNIVCFFAPKHSHFFYYNDQL